MSLPVEIVEKLQQYVDDIFDNLKDTVERLVPQLPPKEQKKVTFLQTTNLHTACVVRSGLNMCGEVSLHKNMIQACLFKFDFTMTKDGFYVGDMTNMGKINGTNWNRLNQAEIEYVENDLIVPWTTPQHYSINKLQDGEVSARVSVSSTNRITLGVYDGDNVYHADWVNQSFLTTWDTTWASDGYLDIAYNVLEYTTADGYLTVSFSESGWSINNLYPNSKTLFGLKSYPFVGNFKDQTFINRYITDNGATNNYHTTYTTPSNKNIEVYYGDNYVIYYVEDDEPVSYDDVKNAFNIAINQINEDNDTDIAVPDYPVPPEPNDDDIDKQDMGVGTNLGGLGGYWLLTKAQLEDLHDALDTAPVGFDPLNSFISLMGLGVDASKVLDATQFQYVTPINIRMSDGTTWQTGVEAHIISSSEIVSAVNSDVFRIQRTFNNFLDYSPYATNELFIPMCGWVTLPDIAVDRDIIVTYIPDIESCKCRAVVSVVSNSEGDNDACVVAEKDGIMGSDVPFSNVGHSLFVGDAIINGANVAGEAITMAIGAGFTKTGASGKTFRPYEGFTLGGSGTLPSAIGNALVSGNINRTHFMTGNSTKTGFSDGESIIVKSVYHIPDMPENYAHTVGLVCNKTGQLTEFNGFTVCDNPHITFSALEAEKEEIKRLLEEGVILPSGE